MPQSGILKTRVFTSRGQLPVEDAAVSIVQHGQDGRQHLLNIQSSDRSGNTLPTVIETPQEAPFSLCDVWVECPGYQLLLVQNVQIFSGVTSIQDLPLIPLAEATGRPASRVDITPRTCRKGGTVCPSLSPPTFPLTSQCT